MNVHNKTLSIMAIVVIINMTYGFYMIFTKLPL